MPIIDSLLQNPIERLGNDCHSHEPATRRRYAYNIEEQLNCLYDDVQAGLFGEAAKTGTFVAYLNRIKDQFPKS
jgi:hypothetical protein